jgi:hypothetical protein
VTSAGSSRYGIAEWYGEPYEGLSVERRRELAQIAGGGNEESPACRFQQGSPPCHKRGGVCSLIRYQPGDSDRIGPSQGRPVIVCPKRFEEDRVVLHWLAEIVGFPANEAMVAREVPFMRGTGTDRAAGKIDLMVARNRDGTLEWYGLEIQAVYFSGRGMQTEFVALKDDQEPVPPFPDSIRRPDWRSSSAKRLMPQLQIKVPTLRRWGSKIAVAVDRPFFDSIGGLSPEPSHDLNDGDIIWMIPEMFRAGREPFQLSRGHWEVLTLEDSNNKLLAAETVRRDAFEQMLRNKLEHLVPPQSSGS